MDTTHLGLAFYKDKWKYFEKCKPVKKGKYKGHYWIGFVNEGIMRLVHHGHIKRMPAERGQLRLFE
jgi:hypothetical protein